MGDMQPMPPMNDPGMGAPDMGTPDAGTPDMEGGEPDDMNGDSEGGAGGDVKKYSGELSQALNSYNEENPSDEEKINKYAINMIAAQVADYLSDKDKRSVIKKLQGQEDDMSSDEQPQNDEMGGMPPMDENRIVQEIVDDLINGRHTKRNERSITNDEVNKEESPFVYDN
jgi:hypothetical protein